MTAAFITKEAWAAAEKPKRTKSGAMPLTEAHVEQTVTQLLELDGWRSFKMEENFSERKFKRTGEKGMPDRLFIRYLDPAEFEETEKKRWAEVLWIEFKRKGLRPKAEQLLWHAAEMKRGALVLVIDDIDEFRKFYAKSGLQRRRP